MFLVALAVALALSVQAYAVKPYRIPSESMEPTLHVGDRVLVNRASHRLGGEPRIGDVVVFHPPAGADAASPRCGAEGEGEGSAMPCSRPSADCQFPVAVTVPRGHVYLLGDNRGASQDSRFWGPVPISWVIGEATVIYWPPDRAGPL